MTASDLDTTGGASSNPAFLDVATEGALGGGNLTSLIERDRYAKRVTTPVAETWSYDQELAAHA
jgi:hypothetical protein